jgi:hypothetical protein
MPNSLSHMCDSRFESLIRGRGLQLGLQQLWGLCGRPGRQEQCLLLQFSSDATTIVHQACYQLCRKKMDKRLKQGSGRLKELAAKVFDRANGWELMSRRLLWCLHPGGDNLWFFSFHVPAGRSDVLPFMSVQNYSIACSLVDLRNT